MQLSEMQADKVLFLAGRTYQYTHPHLKNCTENHRGVMLARRWRKAVVLHEMRCTVHCRRLSSSASDWLFFDFVDSMIMIGALRQDNQLDPCLYDAEGIWL